MASRPADYYVTQAKKTIFLDERGSASYNQRLALEANRLANADIAANNLALATAAASGGSTAAAPPVVSAKARLSTVKPTTAIRTYGALLGGSGLGTTEPLLGGEGGTAKGRLLG